MNVVSQPVQSIKPPYDVWLHWSLSERCHMGCDYCLTGPGLAEKEVTRIRIPELMRSLERTGKVFRISFSGGGEPFLVPNLTDACLELTAKHYISFNTSLAEARVRDLLLRINPARVLGIHASCHIKAMERRQRLDWFIENYRLCRERGIPIDAIAVGYPPLLEDADSYRTYFQERGVELKFGEFIGTWDGREYPKSYTDEDLRQLRLTRNANIGIHYPNRAGKFICNAGYSAAVVRPNGDINPCGTVSSMMLGNIYKGIELRNHMMLCPAAVCGCPLYEYDRLLYAEALRRDHTYVRLLKPVLAINNTLNDNKLCSELMQTIKRRVIQVNRWLNRYPFYVQLKRLVRH